MVNETTWFEDEETFSFKIIYTLKMSCLKLIIMYDKKINLIVSGTVIIDTDEYMEFDLKELDIDQAKKQLVIKAINIGSSVLIKKVKTDMDTYLCLLDNLADLYIMQEQMAKEEKEAFRKKYIVGETND